LRGSGPVRAAARGLFGLLAKEDVFDMVGLGWTAPRERSERAKSGSEASRLMASDLVPEADGCGFTVGPGCWPAAGAGRERSALVGDDVGGVRVRYCRAAAPAGRAALDAEEPIVVDVDSARCEDQWIVDQKFMDIEVIEVDWSVLNV